MPEAPEPVRPSAPETDVPGLLMRRDNVSMNDYGDRATPYFTAQEKRVGSGIPDREATEEQDPAGAVDVGEGEEVVGAKVRIVDDEAWVNAIVRDADGRTRRVVQPAG